MNDEYRMPELICQAGIGGDASDSAGQSFSCQHIFNRIENDKTAALRLELANVTGQGMQRHRLRGLCLRKPGPEIIGQDGCNICSDRCK